MDGSNRPAGWDDFYPLANPYGNQVRLHPYQGNLEPVLENHASCRRLSRQALDMELSGRSLRRWRDVCCSA